MGGAAINSEIIRQIFESAKVADVIEAMYESCLAIGGDKFSYHPEVMFEGMASTRSDVFSRGYGDFTEFYIADGAMLVDPVPDFIMQFAKPIFFNDAVAMLTLNQTERIFVETVRSFGVDTALGFPLWGPKGQNAYVSIGFANSEVVLSPKVIKEQHTLLLAGHQKIVELVPATLLATALSSREIEVLTWVGRGKSNTDVGTILAISPETVATYIRRIFTKLECNDRIGAVIKALKMGLIRV